MMDEREDYMDDVAGSFIGIGRVYAKYGLNLAAVWVDYAGKILTEVSEMLRDNASVIGPKRPPAETP